MTCQRRPPHSRMSCVVVVVFWFLASTAATAPPGEILMNLTFSPPAVIQLQETERITVHVNATPVNLNPTEVSDNETLILQMSFVVPGIAHFDQGSQINFTWACTLTGCTVYGNFSVQGAFLGHTKIIFSSMTGTQLAEFPVSVVRIPDSFHVVFEGLIFLLSVVMNVSFGCEANLKQAKEILKKPVPLIIGFLCQYLGMPTLAYLYGLAAQLPPNLAFGLLAAGASPGGGPSNVLCLHLGGHFTLSLCMTFISIVAALGMLPLWMFTLGQHILGSSAPIPYLNILITLSLLIIPLFVGMLIAHFLPRVGRVIRAIIRPLTLIVIIVIIGVGFYSQSYLFRLLGDWKLIVASVSLPYSGILVSSLVAALARQPRERIITIAIETCIQNGAIALLLIGRSLPQPDADLTAVVPMLVSGLALFPFLIVLLIRLIYLKCIRKESYDIKTASSDRATKGRNAQGDVAGYDGEQAKENFSYEKETPPVEVKDDQM